MAKDGSHAFVLAIDHYFGLRPMRSMDLHRKSRTMDVLLRRYSNTKIDSNSSVEFCVATSTSRESAVG